MYFRILFLSLLLFPCVNGLAQTSDADELNDKVIQQIQQQTEEEIDIVFLKEKINELLLHPINLNTTNLKELQESRVLTVNQINTILNYKREGNQFVSVEELFSLPNFSVENKILTPLFTTRRKENQEINTMIYNHLAVFSSSVFDDQSTYKSNPYKNFLGKPQNYFLRYVFQQNYGFSVGLTLQNDYYEPFFSQYNKLKFQTSHSGFDYVSTWIRYIPKKGVLKDLIVGNYALYFGQGLSFWNGYTINKSSYVTNVIKNREELSPHTSAGEFNYLSGTCLVFKPLNNWKTTTFYSYKKMNSKERFEDENISYSVDESGFHQNYNTNYFVKESILGVRNNLQFKRLFIGNTLYKQEFNQNTNPQNSLYDQFEFRAKTLNSLSIDYQYNASKITLYGEEVLQNGNVNGRLHGVNIVVTNSTETSLIYRSYDKKYFAAYANPFRENTDPANENGVYWGLKNALTSSITCRFYIDLSEALWLKYLKNGPTHTSDFFTQIDYVPSEKYNLYFRYKNETTQVNHTLDSLDFKILNNTFLKTYRLHQQIFVSKKLTLRNRIEIKNYTDDSQKNYTGYLFYQDFIFKNYSKWGINTRIAFAYIEDYKTRIYATESSLPYSQLNTVFSRNSFQWYLIFQYKITKDIKAWFKINVINGDFKENTNTLLLDKNYYTLTLKYDLI